MDLWQLNILCKVIEQGSFSKAGQSIHLSQPTVSNHIKDLESHFGCRLIDRLSRAAVPTEAGKLLYDYARRMMALKEETESALADFQGLVRGRLVVGGSTIPGGYLLPRLIGAFYRHHPDVVISLMIAGTEKVLDEILAGRYEVGIVGAETADRRFFQEPFVRDRMRLIVPADHKWASRDRIRLPMLKTEPFIAREVGSGTLASIQENLLTKGFGLGDLKIVAEMDHTVAVIQGIKSHVGVSILSTIAVAEELAAGSLKALRVDGLSLDRHLYLTGLHNRTPSPVNRAFTAFIKKAVRTDAQWPLKHVLDGNKAGDEQHGE